MQNNFNAGTSNLASSKNGENGDEPSADKTELWKPLNCLVEAANRTKTLNSDDQGSVPKTEQINFTEVEENAAQRNKAREHLQKPKMLDDKNSNYHTTALSKTRRVNGAGRKRAAASREFETSAQALLCGTSVKRERETSPIWFSLISAPDRWEIAPIYLLWKNAILPGYGHRVLFPSKFFREGDAQLPQLSSSYLRIK